MRIKIIEILLNQYSLIIMDPPRSKAGVEVFLSRAIKCLDREYPDGIFVTIPTEGPIRDFFNHYLEKVNLEVLHSFPNTVHYTETGDAADFVQLKITGKTEPTVTHHFIRPFYQHEENQSIHEYKCVCRRTFKVGEGADFESIDQLETIPCSECGYEGKFAFTSDVKLV